MAFRDFLNRFTAKKKESAVGEEGAGQSAKGEYSNSDASADGNAASKPDTPEVALRISVQAGGSGKTVTFNTSEPPAETSATESDDKPEPHTKLITLEYLEQFDNCIDDLKIRRDDVPKWRTGDFVKKSGAILPGTQLLSRPIYGVRMNYFVRNVGHAPADIEDPWQLVAIDRDAYFAVADVYRHGDVTQFTFVEIGEQDISNYDEARFDDQAREYVRKKLVESYFTEPPSYSTDYSFLAVMGNEQGRNPHIRIYDIDPREMNRLKAPGRGETVFDLDDPRFVTYFEIPDPDYPDDPTRCYQQVRELYQDKHTNGNVTYTVEDPEQYRPCEVFHVHDGKAEIFGYASWGQVLEQKRFVARQFGWDGVERRPYVKVTNKGGYASGNVNVLKPGGKYERVASWVKDTDGCYLVSYLGPQFEQPISRFNDFRVMTLYLAVTVGARRLRELDAMEGRFAAELKLDSVPDHYEALLNDGLVAVCADNRYLDGHPALEYLEARKNAETIIRRYVDSAAVRSLYEGDMTPGHIVRESWFEEKLWFNPLREGAHYPLLSTEYDLLAGRYAESYAKARKENPETVISEAEFLEVLDGFKRMFAGNIDECWKGIEQAADDVVVPYRYSFSCGFDLLEREAKVNLFLPQRGVFPTSLWHADLNKVQRERRALTDKKFQEKYVSAVCALGVLTLSLVKRYSPWVHTVSLNAWYRWEEPVCVYSVRASELELAKQELEDPARSFNVLRSLGAQIARGGELGLMPVNPVFDPDEARDYKYGFRTLVHGWPMPEHLIRLTTGTTDGAMQSALRYLRILYADGEYSRVCSLARKQIGLCEREWLPQVAPGLAPLSCTTDLQEDLAFALYPQRAFYVIPRGLAELYLVLATAHVELNELEDARECLERALDLNPADATAMLELTHVYSREGDADGALAWARRARDVAYHADDVSAAYRQMAFYEIEHENYVDACWLLWHAFYVGPTDASWKKTVNELVYLGHLGIDHNEYVAPEATDEQRAKRVIVELEKRGYPTGISNQVLELAKKGLDAALGRCEIPDASYVHALEGATFVTSGRPDRDLIRIQRMARPDRFANASFADYLYQALLIDDPYLVMEDDKSGLSTSILGDRYDKDVYPIVIPYIDTDRRLKLLHMAYGTVEGNHLELVKELDDDVCLDGWKFRDHSFQLIVPGELKEVDFEQKAMRLMDKHRENAARDETRSLRMLDHLRSFARPDDILVVLTREGLQPEAVWMTLEYMEKGKDGMQIYTRLCTETCDDFGLHVGDIAKLELHMDEETKRVIATVGCDAAGSL